MKLTRCRTEHGFTLIELVVSLAILGILLALAIPRYAASGRNALVPEADNVLLEMKTVAWAYYQQYSFFTGLTTATLASNGGFTAPANACWAFGVLSAGATTIDLQASGNPAGAPTKCNFLGPAGNSTVTFRAVFMLGRIPACPPVSR